MYSPRIIIIGAGPTGLGAAWRLKEMRYNNWHLYEKESYAGGLAASFVDEKKFTWDVGGHVQFSHYKYFDDLMKRLLGNGWYSHERESWVWILNRFVPYPFQYNIRYLPKDELLRCLHGLLEASFDQRNRKLRNFEDWIYKSFGKRLADIFMMPYNFKTWAYPPKLMDYNWIGERVATIDLNRLLKNIAFGQDDISWGPNSKFRFPKKGGTGKIWTTLASRLDQNKISFNKEVKRVDLKNKRLYLSDSSNIKYDYLISTMPIDLLIVKSNLETMKNLGNNLKYSGVHIIGIGLKGHKPAHLKTKCWMYFPEKNCPFYRATVFSNYSKYNVPNHDNSWSLMLEVSESKYKREDPQKVLNNAIQGVLNTKLVNSRKNILSTWYHQEKHGYPTPFLGRDKLLNKLLFYFKKYSIYSRGRFGAWKYEIANQDHSLMQGVEAINEILLKQKEITLWQPNIVNSGRFKNSIYK